MTPARHSGPLKAPPRFEWRALRDGDRHAFKPTGIADALCGAKRIDPRFQWPDRPKCPACVEAENRLTRQALGLPVAELGL